MSNTNLLKLIKVSEISHNRQVKQYFKDVDSDTSEKNGRDFLKSLLLIDNNDSAIYLILKMIYFQLYIKGIEAVSTIPEIDSVKVGNNRPQLVIAFRHKDKKNKQGYSQLKIPHYSGDRTPSIPSYTKGDFWTRIIYKDNSKVWIYGKTQAEAVKMPKKLDKYVDSKQKPGKLTTGKLEENTNEKLTVYPVRADFYAKGTESKLIKWRHYF
jgi:hypothetical protein